MRRGIGMRMRAGYTDHFPALLTILLYFLIGVGIIVLQRLGR